MRVHVGTSGWQYRSWRGRFYPRDLPQAQWLEHFTRHFETVEVNNSFYRLPERTTFRTWRRRAPEGFVYAVKGNRFITHIKRLRDPAGTVATFWERASALGEKLGPVLWQLPPTFAADRPRLEAFLRALPGGMRPAFEFRHATWLDDDVYAMLDRAGAAFVLGDRPDKRTPVVVTGGWAYVRFHQGRRVAPGYPKRKLERWADRVAGMDAREAFVYFNNDPEGAAIRDAATFIELMRERGADVATLPATSSSRASA